MKNRFNILLVEDNQADVQLLQEMIMELESDLLHPVILYMTHAVSLKEASLHAGKSFDVILLDLTLPDSKGMNTVSSIINQFKAVPVVVLTGISDAELGLASVKSGAQDYLVKNEITPALLLRSMQYAIERLLIVREKEQLITDLQDAMAQIKTLSGLLPICANCKKIRNDQGFWERIESYISKHTGADFTHGICPECMHKLYPDLPR
jgi:CheY-like chemotaxis protein